VRSPWPSINLTEVFQLVWRWVERDRTSIDRETMVARCRSARLERTTGARMATLGRPSVTDRSAFEDHSRRPDLGTSGCGRDGSFIATGRSVAQVPEAMYAARM
jgi:hypothetical protein